MIVGFVSDTLYPYFKGGIETLRHTEMLELAKERGHTVYSFSMGFDGMGRSFRENNVNYVTFGHVDQNAFYKHGRRSIRNALKYSFLLSLCLPRYRLDVVQVNAFPYLHLPAVKLYCLLHRCRLIIATYEVWDNSYWKIYLGPLGFLAGLVNRFEKWSLGWGDFYTTISTSTRDKLVAIGIPENKIEMFSPGIDAEQVNAALRQNAGRREQVIFAGRLIKEKALDRWLGVVRALREQRKGATGLIVGEGPEEKSLRALIKKERMEGYVTLRPFFRGKAELYAEIARSSVLLNMSEREGLSLIALEGVALGTPVVLPSYTPIPEEVKSLCVVAPAEELPSVIAGIMKGGKTSAAPSSSNPGLEPFLTSGTGKIYARIFRKLGKQ